MSSKNDENKLGSFLKRLRRKKGIGLRTVEKALKIPGAYLDQVEKSDYRLIRKVNEE